MRLSLSSVPLGLPLWTSLSAFSVLVIQAKPTVMGGQQVCNQTFRPDDDGMCGGAIHTDIFCFFVRNSFWRQIDSGAHTSCSLFLGLSSIPFHSHNALNLLSSATDKVNRGGRPPTRRKPAPFRRPAPPRRAACSSAGGPSIPKDQDVDGSENYTCPCEFQGNAADL